MAAPLLLAPIDLTGVRTLWVYTDLQLWDPFKRRWVTDPINVPALHWPTRRAVRVKRTDVQHWYPLLEWPDHMRRAGYRARLLVWTKSHKWEPYMLVESSRASTSTYLP